MGFSRKSPDFPARIPDPGPGPGNPRISPDFPEFPGNSRAGVPRGVPGGVPGGPRGPRGGFRGGPRKPGFWAKIAPAGPLGCRRGPKRAFLGGFWGARNRGSPGGPGGGFPATLARILGDFRGAAGLLINVFFGQVLVCFFVRGGVANFGEFWGIPGFPGNPGIWGSPLILRFYNFIIKSFAACF